MDNKISRCDVLIKKLNEASEAYYGGQEEIITDCSAQS